MVSVKKEEQKSKVHNLMLSFEAAEVGSKAHATLMTELKRHKTKMKQVKNSLPPEVYDVFTKQWNNFVDTCSQAGEHIEDLDKYFDQYFETFMKYPH